MLEKEENKKKIDQEDNDAMSTNALVFFAKYHRSFHHAFEN